MRYRPASKAPGANRPSLTLREEEVRVAVRDEEDDARRGAGVDATVCVAKVSLSTGTPQAGQKRFCSATLLPHDRHEGILRFMIARGTGRRHSGLLG
jgi:hypothetical protein